MVQAKRTMIDAEWYVLAFDTETDGFPPSRFENVMKCVKELQIKDASVWPRVLQIAWVVLDRGGRVVHRDGAYIRPMDRVQLNERACAVHGITMDRLLCEGEDGSEVLRRFSFDILRARLCVAHNATFDVSMIHGECARRGIPPCFASVDLKRLACTMEIGQRIFGRRSRLVDLFVLAHKREKEFVSQCRPDHDCHDAMWDAECAARIGRRFCRMGVCRSLGSV